MTTVLTDNEFQPLNARIRPLGAEIDATSANEHVPEVERAIRMIKEYARLFIVMVSFKAIPILMKKHLILYLVQIINLTVHKNTVSPFLSPSAFVLGHHLDLKIHCQLPFGSFY